MARRRGVHHHLTGSSTSIGYADDLDRAERRPSGQADELLVQLDAGQVGSDRPPVLVEQPPADHDGDPFFGPLGPRGRRVVCFAADDRL